MAYEAYCAACTYMGDKVDCGKYWCSVKGEDRYANDPRCYNFCEAYGRSNSARENMYYISANSNSSCYITTIMCNLLGYDDNNYYLNKLRLFRDNVMQKNPNYLPMLLTYDIIGPIISQKLANDKFGKEIATTYFNKYITKSVLAIEEEKYQEAINIYKAMTDTLANHYGINTTIISPDLSTIDTNYLGHGKIKKLQKNYI